MTGLLPYWDTLFIITSELGDVVLVEWAGMDLIEKKRYKLPSCIHSFYHCFSNVFAALEYDSVVCFIR